MKQYQIRYIVQESENGVEWKNIADCMSEQEALEEIADLKGAKHRKQYRVCEDLQGGSFGMGRVYNIHEWI